MLKACKSAVHHSQIFTPGWWPAAGPLHAAGSCKWSVALTFDQQFMNKILRVESPATNPVSLSQIDSRYLSQRAILVWTFLGPGIGWWLITPEYSFVFPDRSHVWGQARHSSSSGTLERDHWILICYRIHHLVYHLRTLWPRTCCSRQLDQSLLDYIYLDVLAEFGSMLWSPPFKDNCKSLLPVMPSLATCLQHSSSRTEAPPK